jgi:hypothetical protein
MRGGKQIRPQQLDAYLSTMAAKHDYHKTGTLLLLFVNVHVIDPEKMDTTY